MVTDRVIIISNGSTSIELTNKPYTVERTEGFDSIDVVNVTTQGYNQDGETLLNSYISSRPMKIYGQIKADTTDKMQALRDKMFRLFIPKTKLLINHYYGGKTRIINAVVETTPKFSFTEVTKIQNYNVSLKACDPYWRDSVETVLEIANVTGGFHFPLVIPKNKGICFGHKSSVLICDAYNQSAVNIGMTIKFIANGSVSNPQLFNINTREFIRIKCNMEAGEEIIIETGQDKSVTRKKNGVSEDYIGKIDLAGGGATFLELSPGDNLLRYSADSGEDLLETRLYFSNRYAGV